MSNILNLGKDLYIKGRIGWKGLKKEEYLDSGDFKIINATALEDGYIDWDNCGFITKERYEESPEIMLQEDDILISKDGTLGKIGYVKNMKTPCSVASGIFVLRNSSKEKVNFDYLYHLLTSHIFKDFIKRNKAEGSTINHLYQRDLENFEINLPDLEVQEKVAFVLNSIDRKIQNNNKQIQTLESLAKTIYDYWFVQFDFPNEDGKPYKSSGGKMVWDNYIKREIPEGWDVKKIKEIESNIITGKTPSTKDKSNFGKDIPFITIGDIRGKSFVTNTEISLSFSGANSQKNKFIPKHSLCVTCIATPGLIGITTKESQTNQQINSINCKYEQNLYYLFFAIKDYFKYSSGAKTGNTFLNMNKEDFSNIELVYNKNVIKQFYETVCGIFNQIEKNELCNQKLCELKDWILPLLMNGQVHV